MKIAEVADHIGEEWVVGGYRTLTGRARIEGIEIVEETTYGYRTAKRNRRYVKVTFLDRETGEPRPNLKLDDGTDEYMIDPEAGPITGLVDPKDLDRPWAEYAEIEARRKAKADRERDVLNRLEGVIGGPIPDRYSITRGTHSVILPIEIAEHLAALCEEFMAGTDEEG
jgi:hypothetical protein